MALAKPSDEDFLLSEFSVKRLNDVFEYLFLAGLPVPPRPLHHQLVLQREIVITEKMDMHLVWTSGRIFLKPIPRYLLSTTFWNSHLKCEDSCDCGKKTNKTSEAQCAVKSCRSIALGFLRTYVALLSYESDFTIARDKGLLPTQGEQPTWAEWRKFVKEVMAPTMYSGIHRRFHYGELRLGRLNAIYLLVKFGYYLNTWPNYASFLGDQLGWLAATTIYIAVVLTAMQVGLATDQLQGSGAFMAASYGFTVFAIMGPLIAGFLILVALAVLVTINWKFQRVKSAERFRLIERTGGGAKRSAAGVQQEASAAEQEAGTTEQDEPPGHAAGAAALPRAQPSLSKPPNVCSIIIVDMSTSPHVSHARLPATPQPPSRKRARPNLIGRPLSVDRLLETLDKESLRSVLASLCSRNADVKDQVVHLSPRPSIQNTLQVLRQYYDKLMAAFPLDPNPRSDYCYDRVRPQWRALLDALADFTPHFLPPNESQSSVSLEYLDGVTEIIHDLPEWGTPQYNVAKQNAYEEISGAWTVVIKEAGKRGGGIQLQYNGWEEKLRVHNERSGGLMKDAYEELMAALGWLHAGASASTAQQQPHRQDIRQQLFSGTFGMDQHHQQQPMMRTGMW
ncbi:hypothetical protein DV737_g410, partial [Chaetothyriales sp. CBS 132003]